MSLGVTPLSKTRTCVLLSACLFALWQCIGWQLPLIAAANDDFASLLNAAAGACVLIALTWLSAISAALFLEAISRGRRRATGWLAAPRPLRRLMMLTSCAALTTTLTAGLAGPAPATAPAQEPVPGLTSGSVSGALDGLALPDRPPGELPQARATAVPTTHSHRVRPGDTLWAIAAAAAPGASPAELVGLVRDWHRTNRALIGPDPDLLVPGQVLRAPEAGRR